MFQAELDLCRVNPEILALLQAAQTRGLKTGFISDTYWPATKLGMLLQHAAPGLHYDFIYASCAHRTGKVATLLKVYLGQEKLAGDGSIHIGDNYLADILGAQVFGIQAVHYPQPHQKVMPLLMRESLAAQLLRSKRPDFSHRLDSGLMTVRRTALGRMLPYDETELAAGAVLGPIAAGFQRFIEQRLVRIATGGRRAAVLFLGRDGFLPMAVWNQSSSVPAHYVEVNRRIALVGSLHQLEPLQDIFRACMMVNAPTVDAFLKTQIPSIHDYFAKQPNGMVRGRVLAAKLPDLLTEGDIADLSRGMRAQILDHFRLNVPDFDDLTDLILVDLGYSGTIQKCLRDVFDQEGLPHRLHGVYMISVGEALSEIADGDSARNGVLTAVEDFCRDRPGLYYTEIPCIFGLGILVDARLAPKLTPVLSAFADNPLLAKLEHNRLELYLHVLHLQDELNRVRSPARADRRAGLRPVKAQARLSPMTLPIRR